MASELYFPLNAQRGNATLPTSKNGFRLFCLRQTGRESLPRIVGHEIYSFFRRIRAILNIPSLQYGPEIPRGMLEDKTESFDQENTFQRACTEGISQLSNANHWATCLDLQMAAKAFQLGALWAHRNACKRTGNDES
jgi:hypothetical protein